MSVNQIPTLNTFTFGETIDETEVNVNFAAVRDAFNALVPGLNTVQANVVSEVSAAAGVTVDGVLLKDGAVEAVGGESVFDDVTVQGDLVITGGTTFGTAVSLDADAINPGTFAGAGFVFDDALDVQGTLTVDRTVRAPTDEKLILSAQTAAVENAVHLLVPSSLSGPSSTQTFTLPAGSGVCIVTVDGPNGNHTEAVLYDTVLGASARIARLFEGGDFSLVFTGSPGANELNISYNGTDLTVSSGSAIMGGGPHVVRVTLLAAS